MLTVSGEGEFIAIARRFYSSFLLSGSPMPSSYIILQRVEEILHYFSLISTNPDCVREIDSKS